MTADPAQVVLASASPRRAELLDQLRIRYRQVNPGADEQAWPDEAVDALVLRLAIAKARAGLDLLGADLPVLGADTLVVQDGQALGKPRDRDAALAMLARLSGRRHEVISAVAVATAAGVQAEVSRSAVTFGVITPAEAARYWATGEPRDKAGGYAIQGIGGAFVRRLEGSYSGVMGLPLAETERLLAAAGVDCWRYRVAAPGPHGVPG